MGATELKPITKKWLSATTRPSTHCGLKSFNVAGQAHPRRNAEDNHADLFERFSNVSITPVSPFIGKGNAAIDGFTASKNLPLRNSSGPELAFLDAALDELSVALPLFFYSRAQCEKARGRVQP